MTYWKFGGKVDLEQVGGIESYALLATSDNTVYTSAVAVPALATGVVITFKMPAANSGASCTLNVNSLGAKWMISSADMATQISTGDLLANGMYIAIYSTTPHSAAGGWIIYNAPTTSGFATLSGAQTFTGAKQFGSTFNHATAATADNIAYTLAVPITALATGCFVSFKMPAVNSGASCTLNVNSLGAKNLVRGKDQSTQITTDDLIASGVYMAVYDTSIGAGSWIVLAPTGSTPSKDGANTFTAANTFTDALNPTGTFAYSALAGGATTFTSTYPLAALANGACLLGKMNATGSGTVTLNVNSLGAKPVWKASDAASNVGASLIDKGVYMFIYSTTLNSTGAWLAVGV